MVRPLSLPLPDSGIIHPNPSRLPKLIRALAFLTAALLVSIATSMSRQRANQHLVYVGAYWGASWLLIVVLQVGWRGWRGRWVGGVEGLVVG